MQREYGPTKPLNTTSTAAYPLLRCQLPYLLPSCPTATCISPKNKRKCTEGCWRTKEFRTFSLDIPSAVSQEMSDKYEKCAFEVATLKVWPPSACASSASLTLACRELLALPDEKLRVEGNFNVHGGLGIAPPSASFAATKMHRTHCFSRPLKSSFRTKEGCIKNLPHWQIFRSLKPSQKKWQTSAGSASKRLPHASSTFTMNTQSMHVEMTLQLRSERNIIRRAKSLH